MPGVSGWLQQGTLALAAGGMLTYIVVALVSDRAAVFDGISALGFAGVALILGLSLVNYALRFYRWHRFTALSGHNVPVRKHLVYYVAGFAFTVSPGKVGEAIRSKYLLRHGIPIAHSLALLLVERLLDLLAISILALLIVPHSGPYRQFVIGTFAVAVSLIVALASGAIATLLRWDTHVAPTGFRRLLEKIASTLRSASRMLTARQALIGLGVGVVAWAAEGAGLWLLTQGLGSPMDVAAATSIYAVAVLAGAVVFVLPAGIGGTEVAMTALLMAFGLPLGNAIVATALCRVATLWFAVALGLVALGHLQLTDAAFPRRRGP